MNNIPKALQNTNFRTWYDCSNYDFDLSHTFENNKRIGLNKPNDFLTVAQDNHKELIEKTYRSVDEYKGTFNYLMRCPPKSLGFSKVEDILEYMINNFEDEFSAVIDVTLKIIQKDHADYCIQKYGASSAKQWLEQQKPSN